MLYIVGTSIGTIEDTSLRAAKTLAHADIILAEDTRSFGSYYKRIREIYGVSTEKEQKIVSFHDQNEFLMIPQVLSWLKENKNIALVSESGMPIVSDPGSQLLKHVAKSGYRYTVIPGPTALTTAMAHVGAMSQVYFLGFLPKKPSQFKKVFLDALAIPTRPLTLIAYESPHRIQQTLELIANLAPNAHLAVCKELSKEYEEVVRGTASELATRSYKGEITLVVEI